MPGITTVHLEYEFSSLSEDALPKPLVLIELENAHDSARKFKCSAIVDSGADRTFIPRDLAEQLGYDVEQGEKVEVSGMTGSTAAYAHAMKIRLIGSGTNVSAIQDEDLLPFTWTIHALVVETLSTCLLGCHDFLQEWDLHLRARSNFFQLIPAHPKLRQSVKAWLRKRTSRKRR